jgi:DNA mismatch repair protein MutS
LAETPLRRQYLQIKSQYPDTIVFFRLGDFYETFDDDAAIVSRVCDVVLTSRPTSKDQRIPMAGVPYHSAEGYIARLVQAGYKVAVAEQLTAPTVDQETAARRIRLGKKESPLTANWAEAGTPNYQLGKGRDLVERDVVRVITPGTVTEPGLLDERRNNYIAAVLMDQGAAGIAYADITTGEFATTEIRRPPADLLSAVQQELDRLHPAELLVPGQAESPNGRAGKYRSWSADEGQTTTDEGNSHVDVQSAIRNSQSAIATTPTDPNTWALDPARRRLLKHFSAASLEAYGCARLPLAIRAAGALISYIGETNKSALTQLARLVTYSTEQYMTLDPHTRRNLEISEGQEGRRNSLLWVLDDTRTAMGSRLLSRWLNQPLLDLSRLSARQDAVEAFVDNAVLRVELRTLLNNLPDLERLCTRAVQGTAGPRDMLAVKTAVDRLPEIRNLLSRVEGEGAAKVLGTLVNRIQPCDDISDLIGRAIADDPPAVLGTGDAIRPGFSPELDTLRSASRDAKGWIAGLESQERERTGIKSLKVGYNKVFGYYIEISNANSAAIPADYIRKQTLVGAERYVTPELKEYENLILNAQERLVELERAAFGEVLRGVSSCAPRLLQVSESLSLLDVFSALAEVAVRNNYVRPVLDGGTAIAIREGRHPVVEKTLRDELFVPNDTHIDSEDASVILLTGPNMAGKSVYIKQVALIVLLAQIGSFVPAEDAHIGLVDRIFTRVGAQDDIATGRSTFMVEMEETANILNHATHRSLIILDEIGRGTSTYDGLAIARSVVEYIHNSPRLGAKTLFATHYHELTELQNLLPRVRNYNVAVAEDGDRVVFLHKIVPGGADRSYGIHVARLAGLPRAILRRAEDILQDLEKGGTKEARREVMRQPADGAAQIQMSFSSGPDPIREELSSLRPEEMSPLEALGVLYELHKKARDSSS